MCGSLGKVLILCLYLFRRFMFSAPSWIDAVSTQVALILSSSCIHIISTFENWVKGILLRLPALHSMIFWEKRKDIAQNKTMLTGAMSSLVEPEGTRWKKKFSLCRNFPVKTQAANTWSLCCPMSLCSTVPLSLRSRGKMPSERTCDATWMRRIGRPGRSFASVSPIDLVLGALFCLWMWRSGQTNGERKSVPVYAYVHSSSREVACVLPRFFLKKRTGSWDREKIGVALHHYVVLKWF